VIPLFVDGEDQREQFVVSAHNDFRTVSAMPSASK
jgi:hypothetical protein